jgi:hypothetical protein
LVKTIDDAVALVCQVCELVDLGNVIQSTRANAKADGLVDAVARHDTAFLYEWLMHGFSFQGISAGAIGAGCSPGFRFRSRTITTRHTWDSARCASSTTT